MLKLDSLYEDKDIIVCRKPAGVATQTARLGQMDMENLIKNYLAKTTKKPYVGIVHRLDQPVEGVMVFAKTQKAAAALSKQVKERRIGKYYYAIGYRSGISDLEVGQKEVLSDYMIADKKNNISYISDKKAESAKVAELEFEIKDILRDKFLFDIKLYTGRHHQIRLQLANRGYPIVGDAKYFKAFNIEMSEKDKMRRPGSGIALCSYKLQFAHPITGKEMEFTIKPNNPDFNVFTI